MTPTPTDRWWDWVGRTDMYCGPRPLGHHIANGFRVAEWGGIRCEKMIPALPRHLAEIYQLRERRLFQQADQLRIVSEQSGLEVPPYDELIKMARHAGRVCCDRWVFIMPFRGGKNIIAEVSVDEEREMEHLSTPSEVIDYLGIFRKDAA